MLVVFRYLHCCPVLCGDVMFVVFAQLSGTVCGCKMLSFVGGISLFALLSGTVCECNMLAVFVLFLLSTVCGCADHLIVRYDMFLLGTVCGSDVLVVFVLLSGMNVFALFLFGTVWEVIYW